jgi:N-acetylglucosaminyldiphosphoundecaprenol N-acetyl-beta-D-mannosaminyltransferase
MEIPQNCKSTSESIVLSPIDVWNITVHAISLEETISIIESSIQNKQPRTHMAINVAKVIHSQDDSHLRNAINESDIINIDGMGVLWGLQALGFNVQERVTGIDLFRKLIWLSELKGYTIYFLGAKVDVLEKMIEALSIQFPNLKIVGYRDGYFSFEEEDEIVENIMFKKPDMLFLGMSSPRKELFIQKYAKKMGVPFAMGVGGSFDVLAGVTKRAPLWMQRTGLEWVFRIIQEPKRMWKRYAITNFRFAKLMIISLCKKVLYCSN